MTGAREAGVAASPDGVPIAFATCGTGSPALVLIHGWSCDQSYWAAQVEALSAEYQVITLDLGGHGASGTGREAWTLDSFGRDVAAVVEALDPPQVVLVGHSMGGNVASVAARLLGERVKAVVAVDILRKLGSPRSPEEVREALAPFSANFAVATAAYVRRLFGAGADEALVQRVAEGMSRADPAIAIPALESSLGFERTVVETLKGIEAPVIAVNAENPPTDAASLERHGVEVVAMQGVGHFPMMENPRSFNALLGEVVERSVRTP